MSSSNKNKIKLVLSKLENLKQTDHNQYKASCPVSSHGKGRGDKTPSFSIHHNSDGIFFYCHGGCSNEQILNALNLNWSDLFFNNKFKSSNSKTPNSSNKKNITNNKYKYVNHYIYFTKNYKLAYIIAKFINEKDGSKKFIPFHEKNNEFIKGMGNHEKILYNLPDVLKAIKNDKTIFIVEGEKDADTLTGLGYIATTNPFGANTWEESFSETIAGAKEVIIIPDNDKAGIKHLKQIAKALYSKVNKLKMLKLPALKEGEDITDWVNKHNGNRERLERLLLRKTYFLDKDGNIDNSPHIITSQELFTKIFPEPVWAIPNLIPAGLTILAGKPKVGKSWLCLHLANAMAHGGHAFGEIKVKKQGVLYLALEDSQRRLKDRLKKLNYKPSDNFYITNKCPRGKKGLYFLREMLEKNHDINNIIIDTLFKFKEPSKGNKNLYDVDYETMTPLQELAIEFDISIIAVHHMRKGSSDNFLEEVSGTFGLTAGADTIIGLMKDNKGQADLVFKVKGRDVEQKDLALKFDTHSDWKLLGEASEWQLSGERLEIVQLLKQSDKLLSLKDIADELNKNKSTVATLLTKLKDEGIIDKPKFGKYCLPKQY